MGIRSDKNTKDRLSHDRDTAQPNIPERFEHRSDNPLKFWTCHPKKPCLVDLTFLCEGSQKKSSSNHHGPFRGRPALIQEMSYAIAEHCMPLAEKSVLQVLVSLRAWSHIFDAVEDSMPSMKPVESVADISEIHRQKAIEKGMRSTVFSIFVLLANRIRLALHLKKLSWPSLDRPTPRRKLPSREYTDAVRHQLKHDWFAILRRWELADQLIKKDGLIESDAAYNTSESEQRRLRDGYRLLEEAIKSTGNSKPSLDEVQILLPGGKSRANFYNKNKGRITLTEMLKGRYPDGTDIRIAFNHCLATTGWNPAVLTSLYLDRPFLENHPTDPTRYILYGIKERAGGKEIIFEGLWKSRGGPGFILSELINCTQGLRKKLQFNLRRLHAEVRRKQKYGQTVSPEEKQKLLDLREGTQSPWLYFCRDRTDERTGGIAWLTDFSYNVTSSGTFLPQYIKKLNRHRPANRQIPSMVPTDFRDAFAARESLGSGGSIFSLMKKMGHKSPNTTAIYLQNNFVREEHKKIYLIFSTALLGELKAHGKVDPTVLAKVVKTGTATVEERKRLAEYRLVRSRLNIGCKDPCHPPQRIAPDFEADGENMCPVHRCTLCWENAVIFPESMDGICMRVAELRYVRANMGLSSFLQSSFAEELENAELALQVFDRREMTACLGLWEEKIATGVHRVVSFDGDVGR